MRRTFGVVSATHWLAASAGIRMLELGGNAFDAAVAAGLRERPDKTARSDSVYRFDIVRACRRIGLPALQYDVDALRPAKPSAA